MFLLLTCSVQLYKDLEIPSRWANSFGT